MTTKNIADSKRCPGRQATKAATELALAQQAEQEAAEVRKKVAGQALHPTCTAAVVVDAYSRKVWGEPDLQTIADGLADRCKSVFKGDLRAAESMLISQAKALDIVFAALARRAIGQEYLIQFDVNLRLALKAQNQCRMTLETLAAIKNPPVVFAKQANIAHGPQ